MGTVDFNEIKSGGKSSLGSSHIVCYQGSYLGLLQSFGGLLTTRHHTG